MAFQLPAGTLEQLRDRLKARGRSRKSMYMPSAKPDIVEVVEIVEEYGAMCEILYLMMTADRRLLNVEREVLRGALDVLSNGRVRTAHMDAMLDSSSKNVARHGEERCLERAIEMIGDDAVRAETTVVLAAAVALADGKITPEEEELLGKLATGFELDEHHAQKLLESMADDGKG